MADRDRLNKIQEAILGLFPLSKEEWADFSRGLKVKQLLKGDCLINQGEVENWLYFLNAGSTRSFFVNNGKELTVDFMFTGDFVTAYYSLITRAPSPVTIQLLEDTEVVVISHKFLTKFYESSHAGEKIGRLIAEMQYVNRLLKEMDLLSFTAEERYARLMKRNPKLVQTISVKHLSSYLGIHPESLSRIRKLYIQH